MSTMKTNIAKREKSLMAAKVIGSLMAIAVLAIVIFSTNVVTQADEMGADGTAVLATASDVVQSGYRMRMGTSDIMLMVKCRKLQAG